MPDITFSSTVICRNSRRFWKVRAMPFWVTLWGLCRSMDSSMNLTSPEFGL